MTIKAKVICDSINEQGNRLTTFELEYPRIIHSEFMTHRMISRNAASSRAIPFDKMIQQLEGIPSRFGAAQKGMQDNGEGFNALVKHTLGNYYSKSYSPENAWQAAKEAAIFHSQAFKEAGYHKQVFNRLTEPFQMIKVVASATEWDNFFWLRDDVMADPTIAELARKMKEAYEVSKPQLLKAGEWHLPYVDSAVDFETMENREYYIGSVGTLSFQFLTTEQAIKVSVARCAAVSYRREDYGLEKCLSLYDRLVGDERVHASALEHQATPIAPYEYEWKSPNATTVKLVNAADKPYSWQEGISHVDRKGNLWSGNLKGWIQHRKTIKGECYEGERSN